MITIYHNTRCSKSRDGVCFLENQNQNFEVVNYLENTPTAEDLKDLLKKLNIPAIDLVRKKETIWIENFKSKELNEEEIIQAMVEFPKLIERPIVVKGDKAVIARPTERINEIL
ncbi:MULTISPECIES: arsenate reductase (glutaredoxin) [Flavobacterium]|uniref:Arsenate reductase (Glutaredoxin) n=2 Tax=Flavobacterium TaxID=237 RepID=A0AA94EZH1_9FLAO|nr:MULTISPECIES: arsenate reductase (glutaredoxin) [Flavobacterium]OXA77160.1 arsenate reductase (glutaredoxin) [Flavobacterium columnare NBRC 100251 = ATCC 23463]AMA48621.1 arsenate reductase [Flavobacterium covae]AND65252.1 arsenate reductase [Flavobacterium covae]MCH4830567.1 arsenate reductase (glutaredoxin) [Flavobacterium columnare]MCH4833496.1 arsenate reductase (glutaredoxin) [Flavobacterium columnare]